MKARDHQKLVHNANLIRERMEVLQRQLDVLVDELNQVKSEMADEDKIILPQVNT